MIFQDACQENEEITEKSELYQMIMIKNGINQMITNQPNLIDSIELIPISTMTAVVVLDGMVDYVKSFPLLKITRPKNQEELNLIQSNQIQSLSVDQQGRVIYAKYKASTRGILCQSTKVTKSGRTFANSVTISLKLPPSGNQITKDINLKLSSNKIQMCGAKSREMAISAAQHVVDNLIEVENILRWIDLNPESAMITADWVLSIIEGEIYINMINSRIQIGIKKLCQDQIPATPEGIYPPLAKYLIGLAWDFEEYELFKQNLNWLLTIKHIIRPTEDNQIYLRPAKVITAMVNFNYPLGFRVRRVALCQIIEKLRPGCRARYNNQYDSNVRIYYPCLSDDHPDQIKYSTLIVYSTGHVTQSGPNPEIGYQIHQAFLTLANKIRPLIDMASLN